MVYEIGEKVHIIERRNFPEDLRRHFIGEIIKCSEYALRVVGYAWVFNRVKAEFVRKAEIWERILFRDIRVLGKSINKKPCSFN